MHERRKSDESIEITAYLLKHKPIDEDNIDEVALQLDFIETELRKRANAKSRHKAKENYNDRFIKDERARLKTVLIALREQINKNTCKN